MGYVVNNGTDLESEYKGEQPEGCETGWSIGRFAFSADLSEEQTSDEIVEDYGRYLRHADGGWPIFVTEWAVLKYSDELVEALSKANASDDSFGEGLAAVEKWREKTKELEDKGAKEDE